MAATIISPKRERELLRLPCTAFIPPQVVAAVGCDWIFSPLRNDDLDRKRFSALENFLCFFISCCAILL